MKEEEGKQNLSHQPSSIVWLEIHLNIRHKKL